MSNSVSAILCKLGRHDETVLDDGSVLGKAAKCDRCGKTWDAADYWGNNREFPGGDTDA